jgi:hypothetical protein
VALLFSFSVYLAELKQLKLNGFAWLCFASPMIPTKSAIGLMANSSNQ